MELQTEHLELFKTDPFAEERQLFTVPPLQVRHWGPNSNTKMRSEVFRGRTIDQALLLALQQLKQEALATQFPPDP